MECNEAEGWVHQSLLATLPPKASLKLEAAASCVEEQLKSREAVEAENAAIAARAAEDEAAVSVDTRLLLCQSQSQECVPDKIVYDLALHCFADPLSAREDGRATVPTRGAGQGGFGKVLRLAKGRHAVQSADQPGYLHGRGGQQRCGIASGMCPHDLHLRKPLTHAYSHDLLFVC